MSEYFNKLMDLLPRPRNADEAKKLYEEAVSKSQGAIAAFDFHKKQFERLQLAERTIEIPELVKILRLAEKDLIVLATATNNHKTADESMLQLVGKKERKAWCARNPLFDYDTALRIARMEAVNMSKLVTDIERHIKERKKELDIEVQIINTVGTKPESAIDAASSRLELLIVELDRHVTMIGNRLESIENRLLKVEENQEETAKGHTALLEGILDQQSRQDLSNQMLRKGLTETVDRISKDITDRIENRIGQMEEMCGMRFTNIESRVVQNIEAVGTSIVERLQNMEQLQLQAAQGTPRDNEDRMEDIEVTHPNYGNLPVELLKLLKEPELTSIEYTRNFEASDILQMIHHRYEGQAKALGDIGAKHSWASAGLRCTFCGVPGNHRSQECPKYRDQKKREGIRLTKLHCRRCLNVHGASCTSTPKECVNCTEAKKKGFESLHDDTFHHPALCRWVEEGDRIRQVATLASNHLRQLQRL